MIRALLSLLVVSALVGCDSSNPLPDGGSACPAPTGAGVSHNATISADETWKASDGPHTVTFGIKVSKGATLTIEPCATVRLKAGYSIVVEGNLVAEGTATTPIALMPDDAAQPWGFLQVFAPGTIKLAYASVSGGGGETTNAFGMIEARGDQLLPAQEILKLDHVAVTGSASYGVSLRAGGAFTKDSRDVVISGSKKAAMRIVPRLASNLPTGVYTGNTEDAIVVETEAYSEVNVEDVVFHDRGVPYRVGGDVTMGRMVVGPKRFTLTLEAGVTLRFKKDGKLTVTNDQAVSTGLLVIAGTAAKKVVLTSASNPPAAGDWVGIELGKVADPAFKLDHAEIRYAGGPSFASSFHCQPNPTVPGAYSQNEDAALSLYHQPAGAVLTNSLIADSKGVGVNLAYTGAYVDHVPTNTFTNVASCKVSFPRPTVGVCPSPVPCP
ncbi:MAG: Fibronectin type domain protein [Myxococcaceae bacterium]|nr:Fibronectin type domain protein [Myxococcaceae bacterium]